MDNNINVPENKALQRYIGKNIHLRNETEEQRLERIKYQEEKTKIARRESARLYNLNHKDKFKEKYIKYKDIQKEKYIQNRDTILKKQKEMYSKKKIEQKKLLDENIKLKQEMIKNQASNSVTL